MSGCSLITISRVNAKDGAIEQAKVFNGIMENAKTILFLEYIDKRYKQSTIDIIYETLTELSKDIANICCEKVDDACVEIEYDQPLLELSITIKLLMTNAEQMMDVEFFELCNSLNDKYEEIVINNKLFQMSFDFNIEMKNEYIRTITIEERRK